MNKNQDKGFTLVELLIVIVILGILATVTVFAVRGITDQGQDNACSVEQRTLETAFESFYAQNQRDAGEIRELTIGPYTPAMPAAGIPAAAADADFDAGQSVLTQAPAADNYTITFTADGSATPVLVDGANCV